ncbi:DUF6118 family protein [Paracoccus yeei]|uniref:DUF6118 family protein n=1 Tax=Paracoccus yeei TaxID=147645 RepID=UPI001CD78530|nr:DUF6118 family protein [Paracoccus yeei]
MVYWRPSQERKALGPERDSATAFDALRRTVETQGAPIGAEMTVMRRGLEAAFDQLEKIEPAQDYKPQLARLVQQLGVVAERLHGVEHPCSSMGQQLSAGEVAYGETSGFLKVPAFGNDQVLQHYQARFTTITSADPLLLPGFCFQIPFSRLQRGSQGLSAPLGRSASRAMSCSASETSRRSQRL